MVTNLLQHKTIPNIPTKISIATVTNITIDNINPEKNITDVEQKDVLLYLCKTLKF